jgi:NADPH-dependent curcumin reductase CurA
VLKLLLLVDHSESIATSSPSIATSTTSYTPPYTHTTYFKMVQNKGVIFKKVPEGWPKPGVDLAVEAREIDLDQQLPEGGLLVKNFYASFDPYQRGRMRAADSKSYSPPFEMNKPITNRSIFKVVKSNTDQYKEGEVLITRGITPIEEYSVFDKETVAGVMKLENPYNLDPKHFLGALGMPGLTAWSSFYEIGVPKKGETIFSSLSTRDSRSLAPSAQTTSSTSS